MDLNSSTEPIYENTKVKKGNNRPACSSFCLLLVSLGILCFLLLVSIGIISWGSWEMEQKKQTIKEQILLLGSHNKTLDFILSFDTFPVNEYCQDKKCWLCEKDWMLSNKACYLFSDPQISCQDKTSLFGTMNLQEQEFLINQNTTDYYWLRQQNTDNMILGDGRNYTLGFWTDEPDSAVVLYVWLYHTNSWNQATPANWTKVICEQSATEVIL